MMSLSKYEKTVISDLEGLDQPCSECPYFSLSRDGTSKSATETDVS